MSYESWVHGYDLTFITEWCTIYRLSIFCLKKWIEVIWPHLTVANLEIMERVKALYLKRALKDKVTTSVLTGYRYFPY